MSKFATWFQNQHGPRASKGTSKVTDKALQELIQQGEDARKELEKRKLWDEKQQSALYAWQAAPSDKHVVDDY